MREERRVLRFLRRMFFTDNKHKLEVMILLGNDGQHSIQASAINKNYKKELAQIATHPSVSKVKGGS